VQSKKEWAELDEQDSNARCRHEPSPRSGRGEPESGQCRGDASSAWEGCRRPADEPMRVRVKERVPIETGALTGAERAR
jgi:hypothetical protein